MTHDNEAYAGIAAFRASHERVSALVADLDEAALTAPSYADEWTIGQVLSHLGSQSVIMDRFLRAGLAGDGTPDGSLMPPIWDEWNAMAPRAWRDRSIAATEASLAIFESLDDAAVEGFGLDFFGTTLDLADFVGLRLGEHALHAWDIEVALDPTATVASDAIDFLVDRLGRTAARAGKPSPEPFRVRVGTTNPAREFVVAVGDSVSISETDADERYDGALDLPAEAFVRLVYGRLDTDHCPAVTEAGHRGLSDLRATFPGH